MKNLKIGMRVGIGYAIVLVLLAAIAWLGINRMGQMHAHLEQIAAVDNALLSLARDMRMTVDDRMIALRNLALLETLEDKQPELQRVRRQDAAYADAADKLGTLLASHPELASGAGPILAAIRDDDVAARPVIAKAIDVAKQNKQKEATDVLIKELRPLQFKWTKDLATLVEHANMQSEHSVANANEAYQRARTLLTALAVLAFLVGGGFAYVITRGIVRPLKEAVQVAQTVAAGDLTSRIDVTSLDETGQLLRALKDMNASLVNIVREVRGGSDTIASASQQIANGNADLSSRTEEQASSLEETASAMEELTSTVRQNADNALRASRLAVTASDVARQGGCVVEEVVGTMSSINESARKIVDIIGVIDGIAFQTNILALNAAVEAARAGANGAGFAVVATEVRNLAQRSAVAAKDIKTLINDSVVKVDAGSRLVGQAGATMSEVVDSIRRVTDIVGEISAASQEQSAGIEQVTQAVAQMEQTTQQNAALVEEAAAASDSMQDQAHKLADIVSVFRLDGRPAVATAPARAKAEPARAIALRQLPA
jgi:methyl-accepting chemotaxis protein